ncbi:major facilitator superfamily domain-containing protein [Hysterangium stoloniferum]|nr:major facilitator superfamily domain-containing protein [Hysterangium stoloniferum]
MHGNAHSQAQTNTPTELSPLLAITHDASAADSNSLKKPFRLPHTYLIIPALFGLRLTDIVSPATLVIVRQLVCHWWYTVNDPNGLPSDGSNPTEQQCSIPGVNKAFSVAITIATVLGGIGDLVTSGIAAHFAMLYGRKAVLQVFVSINIVGTVCFLSAAHISNILLQIYLLIAHLVFSVSSSISVTTLVCNMYIVDTTEQTQRTSMLSFVNGLGLLATVPSYWLGGVVSQNVGDIVPFWIKLAILLAVSVYVVFVLPESFSIDKQKAARLEAISHRRTTSDSTIPIIRRIINPLIPIVEPLQFLKPTRNPQTGRLNMRLLAISLSHLITSMGSLYLPTAAVLYATLYFDFKSDDIGLTLSGLTLSYVIWMSLIFPFTARFIQPLYIRYHLQKATSTQRLIDPHAEKVSATLRLDLYIALASTTLWTLSVIGIGLSRSKVTMLTGECGAHDPSVKAMAVGSVDPLHNAQILSALAIVLAIGTILGPLTIGSIQSAAIATQPQLAFYVSAAFIFIGGLFLFLVRDSDQYIPPPPVMGPAIVTLEKLADNGKNWIAWKSRILSILESGVLLKHIDGSAQRPPDPTIYVAGTVLTNDQLDIRDKQEKHLDRYLACEGRVKAQIFLSVGPSLMLSLQRLGTAREVWQAVCQEFESKPKMAQVDLQRILRALKCKEGEDVHSHLDTLLEMHQ